MQVGFPNPPPQPKPSPVGLVALLLSIAGCILFPVLAVGAGLALHGSDAALTALVILLGLGGVSILVAIVLAIVALARGGSGRTSAILALVLSVLSVPAGAFAAFWGILFASGGPAHGRPFRAGARAHRTPAAPGHAWSTGGPLPETSGVDDATRRALANAWSESGSLEHASVAAFSTLALDLLALGAPPSLVERTHRAAVDEVAHARACFALASAYASQPISAAPFPEVVAPRPSEDDDTRLRRLAIETACDGCVGEGAAAAIARAMAKTAVDPVIAEVLETIARDEQAHADLAWDVLAWCLSRGGHGVRRDLLEALGQPLPPLDHTPALAAIDSARDLSAHGHASEASWTAARQRLRLELLARLEEPVAAAA